MNIVYTQGDFFYSKSTIVVSRSINAFENICSHKFIFTKHNFGKASYYFSRISLYTNRIWNE